MYLYRGKEESGQKMSLGCSGPGTISAAMGWAIVAKVCFAHRRASQSLFEKKLKENDVFFGEIKPIPIFALPKTSRVRLRARTPPFHGGDTGSNPVRATNNKALINFKVFFYLGICVYNTKSFMRWL